MTTDHEEIRALADKIRNLGIGGRAVLAMEIERQIEAEDKAPPRCPAKDLETGARCVRNEDHVGAHVGLNGAEWLVALRCRIGVAKVEGVPICSRIDGHDGDCTRFPGAVRLDMPARSTPSPQRSPRRGICQCGKARQEHVGPQHTHGVPGTDCKRYRP